MQNMLRAERDYHISMQTCVEQKEIITEACKHVKSWKRLSHKHAKHVKNWKRLSHKHAKHVKSWKRLSHKHANMLRAERDYHISMQIC